MLDEKNNIEINIDDLSHKIKNNGLAPIAEFLIESHLPAFNIIHSIFLCARPFIAPFVSPTSLFTWEQVLEDSDVREGLLLRLNSETRV